MRQINTEKIQRLQVSALMDGQSMRTPLEKENELGIEAERSRP